MSENDVNEAIGIIFTCMTCLVVTGVAYLLVENWDSAMLRARDRRVSVFLLIAMILLCFELAISPLIWNTGLGDEWNNKRYQTAQILAFSILPYFLKGFVLLIKFEVSICLSQALITRRESTPPMLNKGNWFVRNRWIIRSSGPMALLYLLVVLFAILPALVFTNTSEYRFIMSTYCSLAICGLIWLGYKLRGKYDEWGIKKELKANAFVGAVNLVVYGVETGFFGGRRTALVAASVVWFLYLCGLVISFGIPLFKAHQQKRIPHKEEEVVHLREFLLDEENFNAFKSHLERELSLENLAFCHEVQLYRDLVRAYIESHQEDEDIAKELLQTAYRIFTEFVPENAPSALNLSYEVRVNLKDKLPALLDMMFRMGLVTLGRSKAKNRGALFRPRHAERVVGTPESREFKQVPDDILNMFNDADKAIVELMERDSFNRFKVTPDYKKLRCGSGTKRIVEHVVLQAYDSALITTTET
eukprot:TRINITY_DN35480_c0_g1_i1.p1 TRINITY_DN35480_c0_g1~~TRINITY_DN35480_c0_g1_i1.p1  ORF type:complete len:474 (+),score=106.83 TRINITY_DN35480_c0_g1_i1:44-1465(+)